MNRLRNGKSSTHPIRGPELRALRRLQREYLDSPYVFVTERKAPLTAPTVRRISKRAVEKVGLPFRVHPHMLCHSAG